MIRRRSYITIKYWNYFFQSLFFSQHLYFKSRNKIIEPINRIRFIQRKQYFNYFLLFSAFFYWSKFTDQLRLILTFRNVFFLNSLLLLNPIFTIIPQLIVKSQILSIYKIPNWIRSQIISLFWLGTVYFQPYNFGTKLSLLTDFSFQRVNYLNLLFLFLIKNKLKTIYQLFLYQFLLIKFEFKKIFNYVKCSKKFILYLFKISSLKNTLTF